MAEYKVYTERELLERQSYLGPVQSFGGGVVKTYDWSGAVTEQTVWQPFTGNRFVVSCIAINTSAACTVTLFDEEDSEDARIFKGALGANATVVIPYPIPRVAAAIDRKLQITTSATGGFVTIWGWESGIATTTTTISTSSSSSSSSSQTTSSSSSTSSISTTISTSISSSSSSITTSISTSISESTSSSSQTTSSSSVTTSTETTSSSSITTSSVSTSSVSQSTSSITQTFT